jgi:homoserine kinase
VTDRFVRGPVTVRVPATSANLGPGFDALGLALAIHDEVTAEVTDSGLSVAVTGEGAGVVESDETHLVVRAMRTAFDALGAQPGGLRLSCTNAIPHGRGLGSSAAAIVAGVLLARELTHDAELATADVLALAAAIEGHPDNVAACVLGGLTLAWTDADADAARAIRLEPRGVLPLVMIPTIQSSTHAARQALPATVPHADAAFNAARSALLVAALTGGLADTLWEATQDRLHQPYRASGMPDSADLVSRLRERELAAVVSGAGPTVLVLGRSEADLDLARELTPTGWRIEAPGVDYEGARAR